MSRLVLLALALARQMAGQSATPVRLSATPRKADYYLGETLQLRLQYTSTEPKTVIAASQTDEPPPEQKQFREQIARAIRAGGHEVVGLR